MDNEHASEQPRGDNLAEFVSGELTTMIEAAEQAVSRIIERAREGTQQQLHEAERMRHEAAADAERYAAWRQQMQSLIPTVQHSIEEARANIEQVSDRLRDVLNPMATAIGTLNDRLRELSEAASPPSTQPAAAAGEAQPVGVTQPEAPEAAPAAPQDVAQGFESLQNPDDDDSRVTPGGWG